MRSGTVECTKNFFNTNHSTRINARNGQIVRYWLHCALPHFLLFFSWLIQVCCIIEMVENKQVKNSKLSK